MPEVSMKMRNSACLNSIPVIVSLALLAGLSGLAKEPGGSSGNIEAGKKVYHVSCAACHPDGGNIFNRNKSVTGSLKVRSKEVLKAFLEKPMDPMPPFPAIAGNESDMNNLYAYIKTFK
jgi:mono/diheme cytochrome c family protein